MRILLLLICFLSLFSCSSGENVPDSILPPEKIEAVLWDILRADELADQLKLTDTSKPLLQLHTELYEKAFRLHKISREDFNKSVQFYQSRPDLFKPILDSLYKRSDKAVKKD